MTHQVVFDPAAEADLTELYDYLAARAGRQLTRRYISEIVQYCTSFDLFPMRGMLHDELGIGVRIIGFRRKASIAFRVDGDTVVILRILHRGKSLGQESDSWDDENF